MPRYTALVTLLAILFYFYAGSRVSRARQEFGVAAPAMSGHPDFDRIFRVQMNTLEWMPIFLPLLFERHRRRGARSGVDRRPHSLPGELHGSGRQARRRLCRAGSRLRRAAAVGAVAGIVSTFVHGG
jgi:hypothetical protein